MTQYAMTGALERQNFAFVLACRTPRHVAHGHRHIRIPAKAYFCRSRSVFVPFILCFNVDVDVDVCLVLLIELGER